MAEAWAAQQGRPLQISYDRVTRDMGGAAISAAQGLFNQLAGLYPSIASRAAGLDDATCGKGPLQAGPFLEPGVVDFCA